MTSCNVKYIKLSPSRRYAEVFLGSLSTLNYLQHISSSSSSKYLECGTFSGKRDNIAKGMPHYHKAEFKVQYSQDPWSAAGLT